MNAFPLLLLLLIALNGHQVHAFVTPVHRTTATTFSQQSTQLLASTTLSTTTPTVTVPDFSFRGYPVYSEVYSPTVSTKKNHHVILLHGFGCSTKYWRATIATLSQAGYTVHALDLLGQGQSAKPGRKDGVEYSIRLWAKQVEEYAQAFLPPRQAVVLIGNSLGSVVALTAAAGDYDTTNNNNNPTTSRSSFPDQVRGVGMYNCGVGMNSRNVLLEFEGFQKVVFTALFDLLDALIFNNIPLLTFVLDKVVTPDLLRNALTSLYQYGPDRVDDELVDSFYQPAKDPGSPDCLSQIYTNDPGATPMQIYQQYSNRMNALPVHLVWGTNDTVTPITGSVGTFFQQLAADPTNSQVSIDTLPAGHVPFDEVPECNQFMLKWLDELDRTAITNTPSPAATKKLFGDFKLPFFG